MRKDLDIIIYKYKSALKTGNIPKGLIDMALWGIFISAFIIGFSGAIMPGPMLGVTIDGSLKRAGWRDR